MRDLAGRTAFVTGEASGIGLALGCAFAEAGMKVMLADIEADTLTMSGDHRQWGGGAGLVSGTKRVNAEQCTNERLLRRSPDTMCVREDRRYNAGHRRYSARVRRELGGCWRDPRRVVASGMEALRIKALSTKRHEFTPAVGNNDSWACVMAGLVPAISLGNLPPLMAGTVAGHDVWVVNSEHWYKSAPEATVDVLCR